MKSDDLKSFNYLENGQVTFSEFDTIKSSKTLDPGVYEVDYIGYPRNEVVLKVVNVEEGIKIHNFPDREKIECLLNSFNDERVIEKIKRIKFFHKVGILLYGKEGTGKSTIIRYFYNDLIQSSNACVFYVTCHPEYVKECWNFVRSIRSIQDNTIVIIFEEIDEFLRYPSNLGLIKTILDGNLSIDNSVFFATTNEIESLPEAIKSRPSRFKYSLNIEGIQSFEHIFNIIKPIIGDMFTEEEIIKMSVELQGNTLDQIKQFCLDKIMNLTSYQKSNKSIGFKS